MGRTFPVKDFVPIEDGNHKGVILRIEYRDVSEGNKYDYVDFIISLENGMEIKYGCPQSISTASKFGKLIELFGGKLVAGQDITEEEIFKLFVGRAVKYMTMTEVVMDSKTRQNREYARIVDGSLKPILEQA